MDDISPAPFAPTLEHVGLLKVEMNVTFVFWDGKNFIESPGWPGEFNSLQWANVNDAIEKARREWGEHVVKQWHAQKELEEARKAAEADVEAASIEEPDHGPEVIGEEPVGADL